MLIKNRLTENLILLDQSPGIVEKSLVVYVLQLYETFYSDYKKYVSFDAEKSLVDIQYAILILASRFLDNQFENQGRADIVSFLKQDVTQLGGAETQNHEMSGVKEQNRGGCALILLIFMVGALILSYFGKLPT